jgi:hypothetical protein
MDDNAQTLLGSIMLAPVLTMVLFAAVRSAQSAYGWKWLAFLIACAIWIGMALYLVAS